MEKIFNHKSFNHLFGHLWEVHGELTYRYMIFAFKFNLRSQQPDIVPIIGGKFAFGLVDTVGKLAPVWLTSAANFPPVPLTPVANLLPV
jgi:hypothetical protein